jgi:hypothetical protein
MVFAVAAEGGVFGYFLGDRHEFLVIRGQGFLVQMGPFHLLGSQYLAERSRKHFRKESIVAKDGVYKFQKYGKELAQLYELFVHAGGMCGFPRLFFRESLGCSHYLFGLVSKLCIRFIGEFASTVERFPDWIVGVKGFVRRPSAGLNEAVGDGRTYGGPDNNFGPCGDEAHKKNSC